MTIKRRIPANFGFGLVSFQKNGVNFCPFNAKSQSRKENQGKGKNAVFIQKSLRLCVSATLR
jgi:hypothetical protein